MHVTIATTLDENEVYNLYRTSIQKSIYNHPAWYTSIIASGVHGGIVRHLEVVGYVFLEQCGGNLGMGNVCLIDCLKPGSITLSESTTNEVD